MRAVRLMGEGRLVIDDIAEPEPGYGEVLIQVSGAGICGSDVHLRHIPDWPLPGSVLGHETSGRVVSTGSGVEGFDAGDAVLVYLVWSCGRCRPCVSGRENACTAAGRTRVPACPGLGVNAGGMAEFMKVPARYLEHIGSLDPVAAAPLADAGLTPMHAVNGARHRLTPGSTAVVIGIGGLGHMGLQILSATTGVRIIALESDSSKLELAQSLGADVAIASDESSVEKVLELTDGYGADAVFDFVGIAPTVDVATSVVAPDGALRFVGLGGGEFRYAVDSLTTTLPWGVDVRRSYGGTRTDLQQVIALAAAGRVEVELTRYDLDDALQAFDDLEAGKVHGRAVLVP
ncbi:NAD(P)-dependent alcohol dehydrogenase [Rhodococcoides yunnanense]|uniref:NAD(P)-dependent alcohol dehydrogenase n=1 Tax=Rhodococcoides yunnanense TaxID=278209 RepID=UPI000933D835|nr:NAD(P)-dependent alcohol dehydrogenase [Rhodococcus yunnanensis]